MKEFDERYETEMRGNVLSDERDFALSEVDLKHVVDAMKGLQLPSLNSFATDDSELWEKLFTEEDGSS